MRVKCIKVYNFFALSFGCGMNKKKKKNFAESFISIKFEENGVASWEKSRVSKKVSLEKCNREKSVIEHGKSREAFRWRKRIGHMFQLIRWKKSGGVCHVEGLKVRKGGWMRSLTKRKTTIE